MIGWITFCQAQPAECAPEKLRPARIILTSEAWSELAAINSLVNR
ncbi:transglutaminase-like cysteine peptidase, partial [Enterobacter ludwigii]